jgi:hypothetical protein
VTPVTLRERIWLGSQDLGRRSDTFDMMRLWSRWKGIRALRPPATPVGGLRAGDAEIIDFVADGAMSWTAWAGAFFGIAVPDLSPSSEGTTSSRWRDRRETPRFLTDLSPVHATGQKSKRSSR